MTFKRHIYFFLLPVLIIGMLHCSTDLFEGPKPPTIVSLVMSAYEVDPGDTVQVTVTVEDDDDRTLRYEWSASGGLLIPPSDRAQVLWQAPAVGGEFSITVRVSNEEESASRSGTVTVRSFLKPYVEIQSPEDNDYFVQHSTIEIQIKARHNNGINQVRLYIDDTLRITQTGHSSEQYNFSYVLIDPAGPAEIKVEAVANTTATVGQDSIDIFIEGIVIGK